MNSISDEKLLLDLLTQDIRSCVELDIAFKENSRHTSVWNLKFGEYSKQLALDDGRIDPDVIRNFRRDRLFVSDNPATEISETSPEKEKVQYEVRLCKQFLTILKELGLLELLARYPSPEVGNPHLYKAVIEGQKYIFTHRWFKHIYQLDMLSRWYGNRSATDMITLDIGSSYGIFQYLMHQQYPGCHQILVDIPEQLILARYFLSSCYPEARIAGITELREIKSLTPEFIKQYDFILLPSDWYGRVMPGSLDVLTSFACLGEITRQYFDYYVQHPVFKSARNVYLVSQVAPKKDSHHSGASDITLLDFPLGDRSKMVYFGISPVYVVSYGYRVGRFPPMFEYIGTQ